MLTKPTMAYAKEIWDFREECLAAGGPLEGCGPLRRAKSPEDWLEQIQWLEEGVDLPERLVPASVYLYVDDKNSVVGTIEIRHFLRGYVERVAGHIGYTIRPRERKKGYAVEMLKAALPLCRDFGIEKAVLCCLSDNEASRRTILHAGGVLVSSAFIEEKNAVLERYEIPL